MAGDMINERPFSVTPQRTWRPARDLLVKGALIAFAVSIFAGFCCGLFWVPAIGSWWASYGISLTMLRPIHTVFAGAWICLAGIAIVLWFLERSDAPYRRSDSVLAKIMVISWAVAGFGILISVPMGFTSGREYLGYHPIWSVPILIGWLAFVSIFLRATVATIWSQPVYVMMWTSASLLFVVTFAEQHLWTLTSIFADPIVDRRIQWMATGTLVGALNLFVYGALHYVGDYLSEDQQFSRRPLAWALFGLGLLNSFTNYGHHTYHLPQSAWVHWVSFAVSMSEVLILTRVVWDLVKMVRARQRTTGSPARLCLVAAKWWTAALLAESLLLSVPPINALLHGTSFVVAHSMMGMIGLDSMALLGALLVLLATERGSLSSTDERSFDVSLRRWIMGANIALAAFILWLHVVGTVDGVARFLSPSSLPASAARPAWLVHSAGPVTALCGLALAVFLGLTVAGMIARAFSVPRSPQGGDTKPVPGQGSGV